MGVEEKIERMFSKWNKTYRRHAWHSRGLRRKDRETVRHVVVKGIYEEGD